MYGTLDPPHSTACPARIRTDPEFRQWVRRGSPPQQFWRRHLRSANRHLLAVPRFWLDTYGRRAFSVAGPMARILSGIQRAAQTVLGVYLKRTYSRVTSASSALGVLNVYALYKSTHSLTRSLILLLVKLTVATV